jgi:hypothetical protein
MRERFVSRSDDILNQEFTSETGIGRCKALSRMAPAAGSGLEAFPTALPTEARHAALNPSLTYEALYDK